MSNLHEKTVAELADLLVTRAITSEELVSAALQRIELVDKQVHAFVSVDGESALRQARSVDAARAQGVALPPLAGIPLAVKDNMCTEGLLTTACSRILSNFVPTYSATVIERARAKGMIVIGKTNMDEFAMGSSTETSYFGPTRNPWDLSKVPGGTSGGSAAAVAALEVPIALGSDTGGSIRQPACYCGVVGLKPSYGRVSRFGLIAYVSSFDQIGILSRDVMDCALVLEIIAGYDPKDSTSADVPVPSYSAMLTGRIEDLRIGIPHEYFGEGLDPDFRRAIEDLVDLLRRLGASCEETSLPTTPYAIPTYYVIATSEASANLARYDGVKYGLRAQSYANMWGMLARSRGEGFGAEVKRRILLGTFALSAGYYDAYYLKAQKVRTLIRRDYDKTFQSFDALLMPVSPIPAFGVGEKIDDPLSMYLADIYTVTANLAGIPALSLPIGLDSNGLPIGIQFQGPLFSEALLLRIAHSVEQALSFTKNFSPNYVNLTGVQRPHQQAV